MSAPFGSTAADAGRGGLPLVTVIVPTYNRGEILPYLFNALARQSYPAELMELVLVDNSSEDGTDEIFETWRRVLPFEARFYRKENRGPACSRNYGAARARGTVLAFTDSDCMPPPQWLRNGIRGLQMGAALVCGPIIPRRRIGQPGLLAAQLNPITSDVGTYPTANLFVSRSAFDAVGGFDEGFGLYPWGELRSGEDSDFAWRVKRTGGRALFLPGVSMDHLATRIGPLQLLLRPVRAEIFPRLLRTIPELRETSLWAGYFLSRTRVYFYLAIAGIAGGFVSGSFAGLLLTLPWLLAHVRGTVASLVRRGRLPKALAWLLVIVWCDVFATGVLAFASARYRRLVL